MSRLEESVRSHYLNIVPAFFCSYEAFARDVHGREADMGQNVSDLEELIAEFRPMLPAQSKTAQAIDRCDPFEAIAHKAIDEGHLQFVDQFSKFREICLRRVT